MSDDQFSERLARIAAQRADTPEGAAPTTPAPLPRPLRRGGSNIYLPSIVFGLGCVAAAAAFIWHPSEDGTTLVTGPIETVLAQSTGDSDFERCINDPDLLADLIARGSSNPRYAAALLCR